jgi:hypothetical protein
MTDQSRRDNGRGDPYLSVVVATRNDDHGGDPLKRLQAFVNCFDEHCRRAGLDAELIVVEWNPPPDRPMVSTLLQMPDPCFCTYRFIEVPAELHNRLRYADVLPLFQMIAKNVGIRRARGRYVLATNIDIIFSTELIEYIASRRLRPGHLYRVDRHDIQSDFPVDAPLETQIAYCESNQLRVHRRWGSYPVEPNGVDACFSDDIVDGRGVRLGKGWHVRESAGPGRVFRWVSEHAELILDPHAAGTSSGNAVLELDLESNPYQKASSIDITVAEGGRTLLATRIVGCVCLQVPLEPSSRLRRIELRVGGDDPDSRAHLPSFERRDAMRYRLLRAELRRAVPNEIGTQLSEYPDTAWTSAYQRSGLVMTHRPGGLVVSSDPRRFSYCVQYGMLCAPRRAAYRFELKCTVLEGGMSIGVLRADRASWIPASVRQFQNPRDPGDRRFEVVVDLLAGTQCWLVVSNDHPGGDGVSRFIIHGVTGSEQPGQLLRDVARTKRTRLISNAFTMGYAKASPWARRFLANWGRGTLRDGLSRAADTVAGWIAAGLGERLRYRVLRATPEFQEIQRELRALDGQMRELADLAPLHDFNRFLRHRRPDNLHVNGCGDFQLMAREHWDELRGYPEFETFSMNIDGLFSYMADAAGIREEALTMPIYHLEHEVGSGWSPEGEAMLRQRIADRGITWLDAATVYVWAAYMRWLGRPMIVNGAHWGMADTTLGETVHAAVSTATI